MIHSQNDKYNKKKRVFNNMMFDYYQFAHNFNALARVACMELQIVSQSRVLLTGPAAENND
jgi:hypothetical protein